MLHGGRIGKLFKNIIRREFVMKYMLMLFILALTACQIPPKLASQPKDMAKYEAISENCRLESGRRAIAAANKQSIFGGFGLIGSIADEIQGKARLDKDDDFNKTQPQMWHECVARHGYKLAE